MQTSDLSADSTMFLSHLEKHLMTRLALESAISKVLGSLSQSPSHTITHAQVDLIQEHNSLITDYVANSQLVILPCAQEIRPEVLSYGEDRRSIDNAVGISYISGVVAAMPNSTATFSLFLSLFADRLLIENQVFQKLRAKKEKVTTAKSKGRPNRSSLFSVNSPLGISGVRPRM